MCVNYQLKKLCYVHLSCICIVWVCVVVFVYVCTCMYEMCMYVCLCMCIVISTFIIIYVAVFQVLIFSVLGSDCIWVNCTLAVILSMILQGHIIV